MSLSHRKPESVKYYSPVTQEDDGGSDFFQLLSFIVGFVSIMFKYKWGIWISLFLMLSSFFNMKNRGDYKQIIMNFMIIMMGLVSSYMWTNQLPRTADTEPAATPSPLA